MIRNLRNVLAQSLFLVVAAGPGRGVIAAAMGAVIGSLLMLGVRLAAFGSQDAPPEPEVETAAETGREGTSLPEHRPSSCRPHPSGGFSAQNIHARQQGRAGRRVQSWTAA
ncbi:MAG: hypothetical protein ACK40I_03805 [Tabrizicola sp.]